MPSGAGEAGVVLEACSVGSRGGMAGLCPVHTIRSGYWKKVLTDLISTTKIAWSSSSMHNS